MSPAIRNPRVATLLVFALVVAFAGCGGSPERAVGPTRSQASVSAPPRPAVSPAGAPTPIDELCPGDAGSEPFQVVNVTTSDGVSLYAATIGRGPVGLVMANDVPHPLCEELPEARLFAGHGFRVAVFDYRDRGESGSGGSKPGRLDLDVAAAADLLIRQGSPCVALAGSYGGAAAAIVAAISMRQPPVGLVGFDPAAVRGQYIEGPFGPVGALAAAPKLRIPVLYVTLQNDRYVPLGEVRRLLQATGSATKDLVVVPNGLNGWGLLDGSSSSSASGRPCCRCCATTPPAGEGAGFRPHDRRVQVARGEATRPRPGHRVCDGRGCRPSARSAGRLHLRV